VTRGVTSASIPIPVGDPGRARPRNAPGHGGDDRGALIAAVIAIRTRSLLLPIAIHVALDLPIHYHYYYFACRAG
jgi:hypothetical protein